MPHVYKKWSCMHKLPDVAPYARTPLWDRAMQLTGRWQGGLCRACHGRLLLWVYSPSGSVLLSNSLDIRPSVFVFEAPIHVELVFELYFFTSSPSKELHAYNNTHTGTRTMIQASCIISARAIGLAATSVGR